MTSIEQTAYPRLKRTLTAKERDQIHRPTPAELFLAHRTAKSPVVTLGFLIHLKVFQRLGYAMATREIPFWGTGKYASADGTKWEMYEQNLLAEYHIRYGGYGGIGYYHVSDNYIARFSHFIPCGVWEGSFILDIFR